MQKQLADLKIKNEQDLYKDIDMIQNEKTRAKLLQESAFLRKNRHVERDPEITVKFQDGEKFIEELGGDVKEEAKNVDIDIVQLVVR
jgi:hypothetical protein